MEDHHDDLGDDLSGLGDDLQFLIADVTPSDWTDDEDDQEAESIVLHWTQPGLYLANFKEAMRMPALRSKEIEFAEVALSPQGWPNLLLSIRKQAVGQQQLDLSTTVQTHDPQQRHMLIEYFKQKPVLTLVMTVPRSLRSDAPAQHAKQAFIQLLGEAASAQDNTNKSFIAFFEDRADAINSDIWRSLGQRLHM